MLPDSNMPFDKNPVVELCCCFDESGEGHTTAVGELIFVVDPNFVEHLRCRGCHLVTPDRQGLHGEDLLVGTVLLLLLLLLIYPPPTHTGYRGFHTLVYLHRYKISVY